MFAVRSNLLQVNSSSDNFHVVQGELAALRKDLPIDNDKGAAII